MKLQRMLIWRAASSMVFFAAACSSDNDIDEQKKPEEKPEPKPEEPQYDASQTYSITINRVAGKCVALTTTDGSDVRSLYERYLADIAPFHTKFEQPWSYRFFSDKREEGLAAGDLYAKARYDTIMSGLEAFYRSFNDLAYDYDYGVGAFSEAFYVSVKRGDSLLCKSDTLIFSYDEPRRFEFPDAMHTFNGGIVSSSVLLDTALHYYRAQAFRMARYRIFKPNKQLYMQQSEIPFISDVEVSNNNNGNFLYFNDWTSQCVLRKQGDYYLLRNNPGEWYIILYGDADRSTNVALKIRMRVMIN